MKVVNECRVCYKYRLSSESPVINKTIYSNIVSTQIIKNILQVTKFVNKDSTFSFDILTYTVIIKNISFSSVENILFQDNIPNNTKFIENTFQVNKEELRCLNPQTGYLIDKLKANESIEISFNVVVLPYNINNEIVNSSTVSYIFRFNIEKQPIIVRLDSNVVTTKYENKVFKQIQINKSISTFENICFVKKCVYDIDIIDTKVINSIDRDLATILVLGRVEAEIYYESNTCNKYSERRIEEIFGFSTIMIVPVGINIVHIRHIAYDLENISINIVGKDMLLLDLCLLLYY